MLPVEQLDEVVVYGALALPPPAKTWLTTMVDEALHAAGAPGNANRAVRGT